MPMMVSVRRSRRKMRSLIGGPVRAVPGAGDRPYQRSRPRAPGSAGGGELAERPARAGERGEAAALTGGEPGVAGVGDHRGVVGAELGARVGGPRPGGGGERRE